MCTDLSTGQQKLYWNCLKKLEGKSKSNFHVPDRVLIDHFKTILNNENSKLKPLNNSTNGSLDYEITTEELYLASKNLKPGKSPGMDNILNETLKPLLDIYPEILLKLFNSILHCNTINIDWLLSLITAIHKKGAKDDPDNYRGISLMSCIGKFFFTILNNRLTKYV